MTYVTFPLVSILSVLSGKKVTTKLVNLGLCSFELRTVISRVSYEALKALYMVEEHFVLHGIPLTQNWNKKRKNYVFYF